MSANKPSEAHKATMRRHYAESVVAGVPPDAIHRELRDLVFAETGKYSMAQITATTSWIAGEILSGKRVNDIVWDEGPDDTNEDGNFDNPEKNGSRNWQVQQLLAHTTLDVRQGMNFLLLPGQNEYDFDAFKGAGLKGENLLTYILGKYPKSVARYLRNGRKHNVKNRRVGAMNELFPGESVSVQGAYIDYFGQYCPDYATDAYLLPLPANSYPICLGYNFKKGREHSRTKEAGNRNRVVHEHVDAHRHTVRTGLDLVMLYGEGGAKEIEDPYEMKELRDEMIYHDMFLTAGIAHQRNWVARDLLRASVLTEPGNEDFDDLPMIEQYGKVHYRLKNVAMAGAMIDKFSASLKIHTWMAEAAAAVGRAMLNYPIVRHLAEPFSYTSGESGQPFRSYFGVLETRRDYYLKYMRVIEFVLALGAEITRRLRPAIKDGDLMYPVKIDVNDVIKVSGIGSKKQLTILEDRKPIAGISHDFLIESITELGISGSSVKSPTDSFERYRAEDMMALDIKRRKVASETADNGVMRNLIQIAARHGVLSGAKRNAPCPCGSGSKFKKCCMKHG